MLIFEKEKVQVKCDLSKEGNMSGFLEGRWDSFLPTTLAARDHPQGVHFF